MPVAKGTIVYQMDGSPCSGIGLEWSSQELDTAASGSVASLVLDDEGTADINNLLSGIVDTDFEQQELHRILAVPLGIEDWRVGEAIAEAYLTDHRRCSFPWSSGRDVRKRGSSLPGADLVGFHTDNQGDCFAFGEVKTSSEKRYPPSNMRGQGGLEQQIKDLRDNKDTRDTLFRYLVPRSMNAPWKAKFREASKRYLRNNSDIQLFGFLVRDVTPDEKDLDEPVQKLASGCPSGTNIELLALYFPNGRIKGIGASITSNQQGISS